MRMYFNNLHSVLPIYHLTSEQAHALVRQASFPLFHVILRFGAPFCAQYTAKESRLSS